METQTVFAGLAVVISIVALAVSWTISWRQLRSMRNATHVPVAIELLTRDFGREEFQRKERTVVQHLPAADVSGGVFALPEPLLAATLEVSSFYDSMGILIAFGTVDETLVLGTINFRIRRIWSVLEPVIRVERELRDAPYLDFLEDLAARANAFDPRSLPHVIGLRTMPVAQRRAPSGNVATVPGQE